MKRDDRSVLSRRTFLGGAAAVLGATVLPGTAAADRYGPVGGTRILIVGDSMIAGGFGLYLARALADEHGYDVTRRGKSSSGLARPDFFDWMDEGAALVGESPFDASVVMFGGNDVQGLYMGRDQWIRFPDERPWRDEYAARVAQFAELLAPDDQQLFWIGMPPMRPTTFNAKMERVNTIYRAEMAIRRKSRFIDIWSVLSDEDGAYAHKLAVTKGEDGKPGKKVQVRASDGIHLTVAGAHYLADHIRSVVHGILSPPATAP